MEAIQSYYIAKREAAGKRESAEKVCQSIAIKCAVDAIHSLLEHQDIRNSIIFHNFPELKCQQLDYISNFANLRFHTNEICDISSNQSHISEKIMDAIDSIPSPFVMPIKCIHGSIIENQYIIIDKTTMELYMIDPSALRTSITNPCKRISEFFQDQGYHCNSVLPFPEKNTHHNDNSYKNAWSLYVLIEALRQLQSPMKCVGTIHYPENIQYLLLFDFYKDILQNVPEVERELWHTFIEEVNHSKTKIQCAGIFETIIQFDPTEIILSTENDDIICNLFHVK